MDNNKGEDLEKSMTSLGMEVEAIKKRERNGGMKFEIN